jgi:hypothetical protein
MRTSALVSGFLGAPVVWITHLLVSYFLVALACETGWAGGGAAVLALTAVCAVAAAAIGWRSYRYWRTLDAERFPGQLFEQAGARRFLLFGGAALAVVFGLAIVLQGIAPLVAPLCE